MLSEISQREKDKYYMISRVESEKKIKRPNSQKQSGMVVTRKWGDVGQGTQISSYKMDWFWGSNFQHDDYN